MASGPSILIVDDERQMRSLLSLAFTRAGFRVSTASSGRAAIERCASQVFDAVLSDVRMPEMDGHQLMQWLAINQPHIRTVLMTGYDTQCQQCAYSPQCMIVAKPFMPRQVIEAVKLALLTPRNRPRPHD